LQRSCGEGAKQWLSNAGYRRFLPTPRGGHFELDGARVVENARFVGLYILYPAYQQQAAIPRLGVGEFRTKNACP
jgi:hypothetical protein